MGHEQTGTEHILLGLVNEGGGLAARTLVGLGIDLDAVRAAVERRVGRADASPQGQIPFTPRAKKVLELSLREALALGHNYIGTEHLLLGLVREGEGVASQVLTELGVELESIRSAIVDALSGRSPPAPEGVPRQPGAERYPHCPSCEAPLSEGLAVRTLVARRDDAASAEARLAVAYCVACGRSLSVFPE